MSHASGGRHHAEPYRVPRRAPRARTVIGWIVCLLGLGLFVASNIASRAGTVLFAFDQHHIIGQAAGLA